MPERGQSIVLTTQEQQFSVGGVARKLRVEYPGAIYHVMNRGDRREPIFQDDTDRQLFLRTLEEACLKTGWQVHVYCLIGVRVCALESGAGEVDHSGTAGECVSVEQLCRVFEESETAGELAARGPIVGRDGDWPGRCRGEAAICRRAGGAQTTGGAGTGKAKEDRSAEDCHRSAFATGDGDDGGLDRAKVEDGQSAHCGQQPEINLNLPIARTDPYSTSHSRTC